MRMRRLAIVLVAGLLVACAGSPDVTEASPGDATPSADDGGHTTSPTTDGTATLQDGDATDPDDDGTTADGDGDDGDGDDGDGDDDTNSGGANSGGEGAPEPDADTLAFLRGGLWNVPETETRCGWEGAFGQSPGTVFTRYQDPSDRGDFYVACRTDTGPPAWPLDLEIRDPSGRVATTATVTPSDVEEEVSGFATTVLVVTSGQRARFDGLTLAQDGTHVTQVHWWLPHDRPTGTWTVRLGDAQATVDVRAPCGADAGTPDPLAWPLDVGFARNGFADGGLGDHCLAWPDVVGLDEATAVTAFTDVLARRGVDDAPSVDRTCGDRDGVVIEQSPPPGSIEPDEFVGVIRPLVLTVSDGSCAEATDDPTEATTDVDPTEGSSTSATTTDPTEIDPTEIPSEEDPS